MIIKLGKPIHFRVSKDATACGLYVHTDRLAAYDARDCSCLNCVRTKKYKTYIGRVNAEE